MTIARKYLVDQEQAGFYHCTNRCVRRAFLCGFDKLSGRNFDHRKLWLEQQIKNLCKIFSVDLFGYAILDNHYHIIVYIDPKAPQNWSDEDVAERWLQAFPGRTSPNNHLWSIKKQAILADKKKLSEYRLRLGNLSWFMRCLNEPLAKQSNMEDCCTGKFWEGRFYSQALLDEAALISCMAYVDLNPVRARKATSIENSHYTSIKKRVKNSRSQTEASFKLTSLSGNTSNLELPITLRDYIDLVEWTAFNLSFPQNSTLPNNIDHLISSLHLRSEHWLEHIAFFGSHFYYFVGATQKLEAKAKELNKSRLYGSRAARLSYQ